MNRCIQVIIIVFFFFNPSITGLFSEQDDDSIKRIEVNDLCIENPDFKKKYFQLLKRVDTVVLRKFDKSSQKPQQSNFDTVEYSLIKNLDTISYYTNSASYTNLFDYNFGYKSMEHYNSDKLKWIEYYENNKCNNLIWVDTLIKANEK